MSEKTGPNPNADALRGIFESAGAISESPYTPAAVKPQQVPSVGRVVHYVAHGSPNGEYPAGKHRAAIITEVSPQPEPGSAASLCVLNPSGLYFARWCPYDASGALAGSWHWPEHVPAR